MAGVIIKIEKDTARVLTSESTLEKPDIRVCRLTDMQRKVFSRNIITTDRSGNKVRGGGRAEGGSEAGRGCRWEGERPQQGTCS